MYKGNKRNLAAPVISPAGRNKGETRLPAIALALVLLGGLFYAYSPALRGLPLWDDDAHLTKPALRSWDGLRRIWFEIGATQQYYPLSHSTFWLEHRLWGENTIGYHTVSILLHATSAALFFFILRRLNVRGATFAAAVFALHPVMVESVAWMTELKNTLSAVCYLGSGLTYLYFDEKRKPSSYSLGLLLFWLALLSKSVTATLPAALLVMVWFKRGRLHWKSDVLPLLPWFLLGATSGLFTAWVERTIIGATGGNFDLTPLQRGILAGRAIWFYTGKLFWPRELIFIYPRWIPTGSSYWEYLYPVSILALLVVLWKARSLSRGPLCCMLLFVGTLFPALGFFNVYPFVFSFVADHFQYLASLSIIAMTSAGLSWVYTKFFTRLRGLNYLVAATILGMLFSLTFKQSQIYKDARTLYTATLTANPQCWMARSNLGDVLVHEGDLEGGIQQYRAALTLKQDFADIYNNLGFALTKAGHIKEGIEEFELGLKIKPNFSEMHYNLGDALLYDNSWEKAIEQYTIALSLKPDFYEVHCNLGYALFRNGQIDAATDHYQIALARYDNSDVLHFNLGVAYLKLGKAQAARQQFEVALRLNPKLRQAHENLDLIESLSGKAR